MRRPILSSAIVVCIVLGLLLPTAAFSFSIAAPVHPRTLVACGRSTPAFLVAASSSRLYAVQDPEEGTVEDDDDDDVPDDWTGEDLLDEEEEEDIAAAATVAKGDDDDLGFIQPPPSSNVDDEAVVKMSKTVKAKDDDEEEEDEDDDYDDDDDDDDILEMDLDDEEDDEPIIAIKKPSRAKDDDDDDHSVDWNEEEDGIEYELEEHPDDPDFVRQKRLIDEAVTASERRRFDLNFNAFDYIDQTVTPEMKEAFDASELMQTVEERAKKIMLTEDDLASVDIDEDLKNVPELIDVPFPRSRPDKAAALEQAIGISDDELMEMDRDIREMRYLADKHNRTAKQLHRAKQGYEGMSNATIDEMEICLNTTIGEQFAYNATRWLLYDQDFNVTNLMLAAVKHNPDAPILFAHWYPQLEYYERYQYVRDRDFDFTWVDVEAADVSELERYYEGFGYEEIPNKAPAETGIMAFEDFDEEEIKMAAFDHWFKEVYNPEDDKIDLDDINLSNVDNVFTKDYKLPQHPDFPSWKDVKPDMEWWKNTTTIEEGEVETEETRAYRDLNRYVEYDVVEDEEFLREFRGHLVVACTGDDGDLDIAEKITERFAKEFGKAVYVETRLMAHARLEDNVFEIWLESYHIDLIHSKRRAMGNVEDWDGPPVVDDDQLEWLTERVKFLISDDSRYAYRLYEEGYVS